METGIVAKNVPVGASPRGRPCDDCDENNNKRATTRDCPDGDDDNNQVRAALVAAQKQR